MAKTSSIVTGARLLVTIAFLGLPAWAHPAAQANEADSNSAVTEASAVPKLKVYAAIKAPDKKAVQATISQIGEESIIGSGPKLPLWLYGVESPRDGNFYTGVMVGRDPFNGGGATGIATYIVPVVIKTHSIVTAIDKKTSKFTTKPGLTVFDPAKADSCLGTSNNVALTLLQESPIIKNANFYFGGTSVGDTQYVDAFQRSNFWQPLGGDNSGYHVLLNPVNALAAVVINVPAAHGAAVPGSLVRSCSTLGVVDIDWLDAYLDSTVLPALVSKGVNPSTLPIFEYKNVVQSIGTPGFDNCCVLGYHSYYAYPIQTYAVFDFDTTRLFPSAVQDTGIASHEVAEWMDDPFGTNFTPAWGNIGQVAGCQDNLEVGDALTGTNAPPIVMPNGFTYHLQELAFFSWFFGGPSIGIHGWYSDNATFLTDAGPVCQTPPPSSSSGWKFIQLTN